MLAARGDDWRKIIDLYVEMTNRVVRDIPGMRIGIHLCRGNRGGQFHAEGGYEVVAEKLFNELAVDLFFLEYDSPRAGDFSPLRFVPKGRSVVLGLVSTKSPALENKGELKRRIEEASRFVPLDHLALSPQCGFASVDTGNPVSPADQEAKLRLVVETARDIWG
jgi:5-methyltetrahydropteroyltriglutamate--homocysteine methyltransferase